jgi:hypothetical protein
MSRKLLFETGKNGPSGFVNFDSSQGCHWHSTRGPLLRPSDVWSVEELEPRQLKELKRRIVNLFDEKEKETKVRAKV